MMNIWWNGINRLLSLLTMSMAKFDLFKIAHVSPEGGPPELCD